jgi:hypothetical protein
MRRSPLLGFLGGVTVGMAIVAYLWVLILIPGEFSHLTSGINHCGTLHQIHAILKCLHGVSP